MIVFDRADATEASTGGLVIEASSIPLNPGEWPREITMRGGKEGPITFTRTVAVEQNGEVAAVKYFNRPTGMPLTVFND